jgi:hypothetical protein
MAETSERLELDIDLGLLFETVNEELKQDINDGTVGQGPVEILFQIAPRFVIIYHKKKKSRPSTEGA